MIAKNIDVKLNVRPIYIGLVHEYAYEGPCRFGKCQCLFFRRWKIADDFR